jgi:hypothetical protein
MTQSINKKILKGPVTIEQVVERKIGQNRGKKRINFEGKSKDSKYINRQKRVKRSKNKEIHKQTEKNKV